MGRSSRGGGVARQRAPQNPLSGNERPEPIDYTNPAIIFSFIVALISDFLFQFIIAAAIPLIGFMILATIVIVHYVAGLIVTAMMWSHLSTKGLQSLRFAGGAAAIGAMINPRIIILIAVVLPLPLLCIGIILALLMQSKIVKIIDAMLPALATAAAGAIAAPVTGGASLVAEGAAAAEVGAAVGEGAVAAGSAAAEATAAAGARAAEGAAQAGRAAGSMQGAMGEVGQVGRGAEEAAKEEQLRRALGEKPEVMEELKEQLLQQAPTPSAANNDEGESEEDASTVPVRRRGSVVDLAEEKRRRRGGMVQSREGDESSLTEDKKLAA